MAIKKSNSQRGYDEALRRIEECQSDQFHSLDLTRLELTKLPPEIGQLTGLTELFLTGNKLTTLPPEIGQLTSLTALSLLGNRLISLPSEIGQLTAIRELYLSDNQFTSLPSEIGQLAAIRELYLYNNHLISIPPEIGQLTTLRKLSIYNNNIVSLPVEIGKLTALATLYLHENQLTTFPPSIGQLIALTELHLGDNRLATLPPEIGQLTALRTLRLQSNQLATLPLEIGELRALEALYLHDNPGLGLPLEVLGPEWHDVFNKKAKPKPPAEILEYYFRIRKPEGGMDLKKAVSVFEATAGQQVREARVIVIGDGASGKTSLIRALLHGKPAKTSQETTRDVIVEDWPDLKLTPTGQRTKQPVSVHLWDFGGQEPMHAAHPYFFTNRTLFLVVATARDVGVEDRISYWLKMVSTHGKGAPALVAVNKVDQHPMDITRRDLCADHKDCLPADPDKAFFPTSCKKGKMKGIVALKRAMIGKLQEMDQVWSYVPAEWMAAKKVIEDRREGHEDTLTFDQWKEICEKAQVADKEQSKALDLLRQLGTVVSFPEDDHLVGLGVLNPNWVTGAIYPLLTSKELAAAGGLLRRKDIGTLLNDGKRYPKHKHDWLIELMKKFELLFENEGRLLMPARLPKDTPRWANDAAWRTPQTVQLEFHCKVLPESVISKFITRWHEQAWQPASWWRHGIAVTDRRKQYSALVRAYPGDPGRIELRVNGPKVARQGFISQLRGELERLTEPLDGELMFVLGGVHPEKYDDLLLLAYNGKDRVIQRVVKGTVIEFDLIEELALIESRAQQQAALAQINIVQGDAKRNAFGHGSEVISKTSVRKAQA